MGGLEIRDEIGHGTYGHVFRGKDSKGCEVAIKCYKVDSQEQGIDVGIMREIVYLKSLPPHENIIRLDEVEWVGNRLRVSMPLYETDLRRYVKQQRRGSGAVSQPLPYEEITSFSRQILHGLDHLHRHGVFARDVKPANILINFPSAQEAQLVLCDFSLASNVCSKIDHSLTIQTLWYRAIEVLLGCERYDTGIDIWSFGAVLGFMMKGRDIMMGDCDYGQIMEVFKITGTPTTDTWPGVEECPYYSAVWPKFPGTPLSLLFPKCRHADLDELFNATMTLNPRQRCTARQALELF